MSRLNGKVAVITSAASGLGADVALQMAQAGAKIVVGDVRDCRDAVGRIRSAML